MIYGILTFIVTEPGCHFSTVEFNLSDSLFFLIDFVSMKHRQAPCGKLVHRRDAPNRIQLLASSTSLNDQVCPPGPSIRILPSKLS